MKKKDPLRELRRLLDPKTWPRDYLIVQGELYSFVPSNDPLEECINKTLYNGRFQ